MKEKQERILRKKGIAMEFFQGIFSQLPVLNTERLTLRPMRMRDAEDLFAYAKDPEVSRHVLWDTHESIWDSRQFLRAALQRRMRSP